MIEGIKLSPLKRIPVENGDVFHAMKVTDEGYCGFGEVYFSEIKPGCVKGWKRHNRMPLNLIVVNGTVGFAMHDGRKGSKTEGITESVVLSRSDNYQRLTVPPGVWVAFWCAGNSLSMLMDIIPEVHDPGEADKCALDQIPFDFPCEF